MSKVKFQNTKAQAVTGASAQKSPPPSAKPVSAIHVPPLFRPVDWLAFVLTTLAVFIGYYLTLSPNLTLEDSGELAVGSYYAGIPHPPGYPIWTMYTWLFTVILPVSNIAWRVAVASALAGALSCGLLAFLVSRGGSMMVEGIAELKEFDRRWENAICVVSGFVAGTLLGFNGFMWSQSVIVEVYSFCVLSLMGLMLFLLRWTYAPHQSRYLCLAFFLHGICFNNHQSLLVAVLGMEVLVLVVQPKLARELFFWNSILYFAGLLLQPSVLTSNAPVFVIFNTVGITSVATWVWLAFTTKLEWVELGRDLALVVLLGYLGAIFGVLTHFVTGMERWMLPMHLVGITALAAFLQLIRLTRPLSKGWLVTLGCGGSWMAGAAFYLYMPLAGMSNPPMQWGYPRTVEGFFHAFTRGQYEKIHPTSGTGDTTIEMVSSFFVTFGKQMWMYLQGMNEEFNLVYLMIALVMFFFYRKMQGRERAWTLGVAAIFICLGPFLVLLLNPGLDKQALDLFRVFFTASHVLVAMSVGYGLTLIAASMATQYARLRPLCWIGGGAAFILALCSLGLMTEEVFSTFSFHALKTAFNKNQYALPVYASLILVASTLLFLVGIFLWRKRAPLALTLALFATMPLYSVLSHWADNEQRGHMFGFWFGHDMFTPPFTGPDGKLTYDPKLREEMMKDPEKAKFIYPEMTRNAILYGGTDPGRFCPTYMIFDESFIPPACKKDTDPNFDRRDVYIITQNALADGTYLNYIRAHYNRSAQKIRGLDTPFFQELVRSPQERGDNWETNIIARMVSPLDTLFTHIGETIEKKRRAGSSFFKESDFKDLKGLSTKLRTQPNLISGQLSSALSPETRSMLAGGDNVNLRRLLAGDLNRLLEKGLYDDKIMAQKVDDRWKAIFTLEAAQNEIRRISQNQLGPVAMRQAEAVLRQAQERITQLDAEIDQLAGQVEAQLVKDGVPVSPYLKVFIREVPQSFTRIRLNRLLLEAAFPDEIAASPGGVYPDREMQIASPSDSQICFDQYLQDAQRRAQLKQLKPGEDVKIIDNKVQVSGQVAVMSINGLLTKVMFDKNPENEFFVEESFPLDWMYPHLTPFSVIMKINRKPLPTLTEDILQRDHDFWSKFSDRLIGNWITYDTPVSNIVAFVEKVYLRHDWSGLTPGQRQFVRDDQGQKAFSKLRSSIGGIYAWRISPQCPPEYRPKTAAEFQSVAREADFTFRQAFAYCPYSPEAVFRYVNVLLQFNRLDDALLVSETCLKIDPNSGSAADLVRRLREFKKTTPQADAARNRLIQLEEEVRKNPTNYQAAFDLASMYMQMQQPDLGEEVLDRMMNDPHLEPNVAMAIFKAYVQMGKWNKIEAVLEKMAKLMPNEPEVWFDLAGVKANVGKPAESLKSLAQALDLSRQRLATNPGAHDLQAEARKDARFNAVRQSPEFQKLVPPL
jgi:tetratricopeptide (TPR) repeat protein